MYDKAIENLRRIRGIEEVDKEFNDLVEASKPSNKVDHPWKNLVERKYRPHLTMAITIPFFQQFTGINIIMFYAPVLFKTTGFHDNASLMSAVITGAFNVLATFVSIYGVNNWGRRLLFLQGGVQNKDKQKLKGSPVCILTSLYTSAEVSSRTSDHIAEDLI